MKRLTEGTHQASDTLTIAYAEYSGHDSFSRTTVHNSM